MNGEREHVQAAGSSGDPIRPRRANVRWPELRRSVRRLEPLIANRLGLFAALLASAVGAGLAEAGVLAIVAHVATALSEGDPRTSLQIGPADLSASTSALLVWAAVLGVIRLVLQLFLARLPATLSGHVQRRFRLDLFASFLSTSWTERARDRDGHLQELMGSQVLQAGMAVLHIVTGLCSVVMFLMLAVAAFVVSPATAAVITATVGVLLLVLRPLSRRVRRGAAATSAASLSQAAGIAESVRMTQEIEVFGARDAERSRIERLVGAYTDDFVRLRTTSRVVPALYESGLILLVVGGLAIVHLAGATRVAALGTVVLLLVRASAYGQQFQTSYLGLREALPYVERLSDAVARYREATPARGTVRPDRIGPVDLDRVSFAYSPGAPVLHDITLTIERGEAVGIVGPTGAGKSTLVDLLLRLRTPTSGVYRVGDTPATDVDDAVWHRKVSYLAQEPRILTGTVAENIRFFREWIDDEAIERAARLAHIHDDVLTWRDGYETSIGHRTDAISGGQRQRLCLARALAGEPELLLLDEPTSALDTDSERLIQDSLRALHGSLTLVIVAHRMATLELCDRLIVLRAGRVEAFAPAVDLYAVNDFYREAVRASVSNGRD